MIAGGAFFGDEARKQALLQDIRDKGPLHKAWLTVAAIEASPAEAAAEAGVHPALALLLPPLGLYNTDPQAQAFYEAVLEAVPVGADGADIIRRWFLWAWDQPQYGLSLPLRDTPVLEAAEKLVDLVRTSRTEPVDAKVWRRARAALAAAAEAAGVEGDRYDPVLSMGWDLDKAPGASNDVVSAWSGPVMMKAYAATTWAPEDDAAFNANYGNFSREAVARIGEIRQGDPEQYAQFKAIEEELWNQDPALAGVWERHKARQKQAQDEIARWRQEVRRGLIVCAAEAG